MLGEQAVRGDARGRRRRGDLDHRLGPGGRDRDDVEPARVERGERERDPRREMLDRARARAATATASTSSFQGASPTTASRMRARLGDRGRRPRASTRPSPSSSGDDERDVVALAEAHPRDARAQVELGHHLGERRLLGARDEHGVGAEHRRPRRRGARPARRARRRRRRTGRAPRRSCSPCRRATASSARTASAISSGAVPAPVRQATVALRLIRPPPRTARRA